MNDLKTAENRHHLPSWPLRFFRWYCHPEYQEDIEGDLRERFERNAKEKGIKAAKWAFIKDVILLFRPGIIRNILRTYRMTRFGILKNYFVTIARNSKKEKAFAILNVLCLTLGFTSCLYIGLYIMEELSHDKFHKKAERIYRINQTFIWGGTDKLFGSTGPGVMGAIKAEVPEFEAMTRVLTVDDAIEQIMCQYNGDESYPTILRHDLVKQMPVLNKKYLKYASYKGQTIRDIFSPEQISKAIVHEVKMLESVVLLSGPGGYKVQAMPKPAQIAPVYAILPGDFDGDGIVDILLGGNLYNVKPEVGRYDASYGTMLKGLGNGSFEPLSTRQSGILLDGEIRDFARLEAFGENLILVARNNDAIQVYKLNN